MEGIMIKKYKAILIIAAILMILSACSPQEDSAESITVNKGVLKVGMDLQYPPFETFDDDNEPYGISVDVAQGLADRLGLELEVVNMDFSTLIPSLETGAIDIAIASMSITEERELKVDFSKPYFYFKIIGLLNKDYATENNLGEDAAADDLWAVEDTKFIGLAGQISTSIPESHGFTVQEAIDKASAITEVTQGRSDVLIMSPEVIVNANTAYPDTTQVFWSALDVSPIGMAVAEGNAEILAEANAYIDTLDEEGGVYDTLREKYQPYLDDLYGGGVTMDIYIYE
jgi:polar amino acid transport system substrate-binding protein